MIGCAMVAPLLFMVTCSKSEPISRVSVQGCYTAPNAPALLIAEDAIHIIEPARRKFKYVAEASKTSYQLSVEPALGLALQPDGRFQFVQDVGVGYFWPLLPANGKNRNRVRHPEEYAGKFKMSAFANNGFQDVIYTRTSVADVCRDVR